MNGSRAATEDDDPMVTPAIFKAKAQKTCGIFAAIIVTGLLIGMYAPAPVNIDADARTNYELSLLKADSVKGLHKAEAAYYDKMDEMQSAKVWFWRFRSEHRAAVARIQPEVEKAKAIYDEKKRQKHQLVLAAKRAVGIWSQYGVDETREQFWRSFQSGKDVAKSMLFYDMLFSMAERNENLMEYFVKVAMRAVSNYTLGMVYATISFLWNLGSIIWSYSPNPASGIIFFAVAGFCAMCVIGAFLLMIYATCFGGFMFLRQQASQQRRRYNNGMPQRIPGYRQRQHYD
eukprot:g2911.t1